MVRLNKNQFKEFQDKILAHHFSLVKFIAAFYRRSENIEKYVLTDRFSLKTFLQEYNVIRHVPKDSEGTRFESKKLIRLSNALDRTGYDPFEIDHFVKQMCRKQILTNKATSLCSKVFYLGNPNHIFMYDSYVRSAIRFTGSYSEFYERIQDLIAINEFNDYITELHERVKPKMDTLERWANSKLSKDAQRIRVIDRYLMVTYELGETIRF